MGMLEFDSIAVEQVVASTNPHAIMNACRAGGALAGDDNVVSIGTMNPDNLE